MNALQVNRSARIVLQLTFSTLFLGILVKAITLALFEKVLPREYSVSPAFDLAFYVIFASTAAWMCYMAVKTANEEYACGATYLQAFQALVWALAASCAFSLLLLALIDAAGERVNLVVVLNNAAFGGLYFAIGIFTGRLQRDIDALGRAAAATSRRRRGAVAHRAGQRGGLRAVHRKSDAEYGREASRAGDHRKHNIEF